MYITRLVGADFRSFSHIELDLAVPEVGRPLSNVTLLLGPNGSGKTSLLRALALATSAEPLRAGGFLSRYNVHRSRIPNSPRQAVLQVDCVGDPALEETDGPFLLSAELERIGDSEVLTASLPNTPREQWRAYQQKVLTESSSGWFVTAYHASRRAEAGESFSKAARSKSRSERYERVAGLFEEHVDLIPLARWLPQSPRRAEATAILQALLPDDSVRVLDEVEGGELLFEVDGVTLTYAALSDGYRAFLSWTGDLLARLSHAAPHQMRLADVPGVVLVDEVDLHLHPGWQREILHRLSAAFPKLQIIATTHSPIVLGSVRHDQVRVLRRDDKGASHIQVPSERTWGRSPDQLLASPIFGLERTRDKTFVKRLDAAQRAAETGDLDDAINYARLLSRGGED